MANNITDQEQSYESLDEMIASLMNVTVANVTQEDMDLWNVLGQGVDEQKCLTKLLSLAEVSNVKLQQACLGTQTYDWDVSHIMYPECPEDKVSENDWATKLIGQDYWKIILGVFYLLVIVTSLWSNIPVLFKLDVMEKSNNKGRIGRRVLKPMRVFQKNLAAIGILVAFFCIPFHYLGILGVPLPEDFSWYLCKASGFIQLTVLLASTFTLVAIAGHRYGMACNLLEPNASQQFHSRAKYCLTRLLPIWILAAVFASPFGIFREQKTIQWLDQTETICANTWPKRLVKETRFNKDETSYEFCAMENTYELVYFALVPATSFFVPLVAMVVLYVLIVKKVRSLPRVAAAGTQSQRKDDKQSSVIKRCITATTVFFMSWILFQICAIHELVMDVGEIKREVEYWIQVAKPLAYFLAYANAAYTARFYEENFSLSAGLTVLGAIKGNLASVKELLCSWRSSTNPGVEEIPVVEICVEPPTPIAAQKSDNTLAPTDETEMTGFHFLTVQRSTDRTLAASKSTWV